MIELLLMLNVPVMITVTLLARSSQSYRPSFALQNTYVTGAVVPGSSMILFGTAVVPSVIVRSPKTPGASVPPDRGLVVSHLVVAALYGAGHTGMFVGFTGALNCESEWSGKTD